MLRIARHIPGYLVLGIILTWVAAAACALWAPLSPRTSIGSQAKTQALIDAVADFRGSEKYVRRLGDELGYWDITVDQWSGIGITVRQIRCDPVSDTTPTSAIFLSATPGEIRTGWPFRCFVATCVAESSGYAGSILSNGIPIDWRAARPLPTANAFVTRTSFGISTAPASAIVPIKPALLPLAANILFWALASLAAATLFTSVRARLRIARGVCPRCRYPRKGRETCPECGLQDRPAQRTPNRPTTDAQATGPSSPTMSCGVRRIVGSFILGVMLTALTAIAAALWAPLEQRPAITATSDPGEVHTIINSHPNFHLAVERLQDPQGRWEVNVQRWTGIGFDATVVRCVPFGQDNLRTPSLGTLLIPPGASPDPSPDARELRSGWPLPCFIATPSMHFEPTTIDEGLLVERRWVRDLPVNPPFITGTGPIPIIPKKMTIVPLRPLVLPLLANIAIWSCAVYAVIAIPPRLRRRLRISRGLCPHCRYPIRGLAECPECGPSTRPHTAT